MVAHLHFTEDAFALQFFLQDAERLINVIFAYKYLQVDHVPLFDLGPMMRTSSGKQNIARLARGPRDW